MFNTTTSNTGTNNTSSKHIIAKATRPAAIEMLEGRQLFAAALPPAMMIEQFAYPQGNWQVYTVLEVTLTNGNDNLQANLVQATSGQKLTLTAKDVTGKKTLSTITVKGNFNSIKVNGLGGNDTLVFTKTGPVFITGNGLSTTINVEMSGGKGNDKLSFNANANYLPTGRVDMNAFAYGDDGADTMQIVGSDADEMTVPFTCFGGNGDDKSKGGNGQNWLYSGAGNDINLGGKGIFSANVIDAGIGNDVNYGGDSYNEFIMSEGIDYVDGSKGIYNRYFFLDNVNYPLLGSGAVVGGQTNDVFVNAPTDTASYKWTGIFNFIVKIKNPDGENEKG